MVREVETRRDVLNEHGDIGEREMAVPVRAVGQDLALDERHHDVDQAVLRLAEPNDVADVRVGEAHAHARFAAKARHRIRVL